MWVLNLLIYVFCAGQIMLMIAGLYTLYLICKAKETRTNFYLLSMVGFSMIYCVSSALLFIWYRENVVP